MVKNSRHVHEVQAHRQETLVPKNLRKKPRGPGTTGPGRHGKVRKQEQGLPMDTDGCRNPEPIPLYDTCLQEGHQEHDEGRPPSVGNFKRRFGKYPDVVQFDEGKEFDNVGIRNLLKSHDVNYFSTQSDKKAAIVERFNRTLKTMMWKYFYSKGTYNWVEANSPRTTTTPSTAAFS